jgi:hypothetical protein
MSTFISASDVHSALADFQSTTHKFYHDVFLSLSLWPERLNLGASRIFCNAEDVKDPIERILASAACAAWPSRVCDLPEEWTDITDAGQIPREVSATLFMWMARWGHLAEAPRLGPASDYGLTGVLDTGKAEAIRKALPFDTTVKGAEALLSPFIRWAYIAQY